MAKETIAKLTDSGFGFIKPEQGEDLFFHRNELEGVEFEKGQGRDGRPAVVRVRLTETPVDDDSSDGGDDGGDGDD